MKEKIVNLAKQHIGAFLVAVALLVLGHSLLQEHDARLVADAQVKAAQAQIKDIHAEAKTKVTVLQKKAKTVKTPEAAVEAIPEVSDLPLHPIQSLTAPDKVEVDAVALYQNLNKCAQDGVNLDACNKVLEQKDIQITALKKKPGFWKRVKKTTITLGIGAAAGYVLANR